MFILRLLISLLAMAYTLQRQRDQAMTSPTTAARPLPGGFIETINQATAKLTLPGEHLHHLIEVPRTIAEVHWCGELGDFESYAPYRGDGGIDFLAPSDPGWRPPPFIANSKANPWNTPPTEELSVTRAIPFFLISPLHACQFGWGWFSIEKTCAIFHYYNHENGEYIRSVLLCDPRIRLNPRRLEDFSREIRSELTDRGLLGVEVPSRISIGLPA